MAVRTVLVIDDNPAVASAMEVLLRLRDIRTVTAQSPDEGLAALTREGIDLVICDMNFSADTTSGEEGAALFRALRAAQPDLPVILMTAWTHVETAVQLVKAGAADYIGKPWGQPQAPLHHRESARAGRGHALAGTAVESLAAAARAARKSVRRA